MQALPQQSRGAYEHLLLSAPALSEQPEHCEAEHPQEPFFAPIPK